MADEVRCTVCGQINKIPSCLSCGADLPTGTDDITRDRVANSDDLRASEQDQTVSDRDQTGSDRDQTASDQDQQSSDEDQDAADEDLAAGGDSVVHEHSATARDRTTEDRDTTSTLRDETAEQREQTAEDRDRVATLRDRAAESRDDSAHREDLRIDDRSLEEVLLRSQKDRMRAAADRASAIEDRARAAADREQAAHERAEARRTRSELAEDVRVAATDGLTGARTRKVGLEEVTREIERANRTGTRLSLAFVDVDHLKEVNDEQGHLAGDELLKLTAEALRTHLRPYDVIVRYGGDEFVCAMSNLPESEARSRFENIAQDLVATNAKHSITFGLAEYEPTDTLHDLIGRADADLLDARHQRTNSGD